MFLKEKPVIPWRNKELGSISGYEGRTILDLGSKKPSVPNRRIIRSHLVSPRPTHLRLLHGRSINCFVVSQSYLVSQL